MAALGLLPVLLALLAGAGISSCKQEPVAGESRDVLPPPDLNQYLGDPPSAQPQNPPADPGKVGVISDAPMEFIELNSDISDVVVGTAAMLSVLGIDADKYKRDLTTLATLKISDPELAEFDKLTPGMLVAKATGKVEITAEYQGLVAKRTFTFFDVTLSRIEITPSSIVVGTSQRFFATGFFSDGKTQDLSNSVIWTTSDDKTVALDEEAEGKGVFKALSQGQVSIGVVYQSRPANATITAKLMPLASITLEADTTSVLFGTPLQVRAIGTFMNGTQQDVTSSLTWSSDIPAVATVSNELGTKGLVDALSHGTVVIKGEFEGMEGTLALSITTVTYASVRLDPVVERIPKGMKFNVGMKGVFLNNSTQDITTEAVWTSSAPYIATVSNAEGSEGLIETWETGEFTLTATYGQYVAETVIEVTEPALTEIKVTADTSNVSCGVGHPLYAAEGLFSDGSTLDISSEVTWSVENPAHATISNDVDNKGRVTTLKAGNTKVLATLTEPVLGNTVTGDLALTVNPPVLEGYDVTAAYESIPVGATMQMFAIGRYTCDVQPPVYFTDDVTWTSTNTTYATVSNVAGSRGLVSTMGIVTVPVTTTIKAAKNGLLGTYDLQVRQKEVVSIVVNTPNQNVDVGGTLQATATANFSDGTTENMTNTDAFPGYSISWWTGQATYMSVDDDVSKGLISGLLERGGVQVFAQLTTPENKTFTNSKNVNVRSPCASGRREHLYCWFMGNLNQDCQEVCTDNGASYLDAEATFIGSEGNTNACTMVLARFGFASLGKDNQAGPDGQGVGCSVLEFAGLQATRRYTTPATTATAKHPNIKRICSCRQ